MNKQMVNSKEVICEKVQKKRPEVQQLVGDCPKMFMRRGRVENYEIKVMKDDFSAKSHRIPIHLQKQVDREI